MSTVPAGFVTIEQVNRAFRAMRAASAAHDDAPLEALTTTAELYVVATYWNPDFGIGPMLWVARHLVCDTGIAAHLFWITGPADVLAYATADSFEQEYGDTGAFELCHAVLDRWRYGGYTGGEVAFTPDPTQVAALAPFAGEVPPDLLTPIRGTIDTETLNEQIRTIAESEGAEPAP